MMTGGCQCGAVRYGFPGPPTALFVCHCLECRHQSASAFGISVIVPREGFRAEGETRYWERDTDSGRRLRCVFCPACGSRLWHAGVPGGVSMSVKGGSLDTPVDLSQAVHIWTSRKLPGVVIPPDARQFPEEPD